MWDYRQFSEHFEIIAYFTKSNVRLLPTVHNKNTRDIVANLLQIHKKSLPACCKNIMSDCCQLFCKFIWNCCQKFMWDCCNLPKLKLPSGFWFKFLCDSWDSGIVFWKLNSVVCIIMHNIKELFPSHVLY
jgi:hypothetical protein